MSRLARRKAPFYLAFLCISAIAFTTTVIPARADEFTDWCWQNPRTTQNELWGVSVVNKNIIWVAGYERTILKTVNGGDTWSVQDVPTAYNLSSISAVDETTAWTVGGNDVEQGILKTTDGGETWILQTNPTGTLMHSVSAVNANTAWAVGFDGKIIKTVNGGQTWIAQTSPTTKHLLSVCAVDESTAWAAGYTGTIIKTIDGTGWTVEASDTTESLWALTAVSSTHAWAVGDNGVITLTNDGAIWKSQTITGTPSLRGASAADDTHAWAVGTYGTLYATTDGTSWEEQTSPGSASLNGVCMFDSQTAWAVGNYGTIIRTSDSGASWLRQSSEMDAAVNNTELKMVDNTTGWVVGYENVSGWGRIYKTTDAGFTWTRQDPPGTITSLLALAALNSTTAWATGYKGYTWKTADGQTWAQVATPDWEYGAMHGIAAADADTVWQVGDGGQIWKTDNGADFTAQPSPTSYDLAAVHAISPATAYAVGQNGTILKTTNGTSWELQTSISPATSLYFSDVFAVDAATAWAVGENGIIYKTTDGANWFQQTSPTSIWLNSIWAFDVHTAWAVPDQGSTIIKTTNGADWKTVASPLTTALQFMSITGVKPDCVWATGLCGTILHTFFVDSANPAQGPQGRLITISGSGFGATQDASHVSFGGIPASNYASWSDSSITCFVPAGAPDGATSVWVKTPWGVTRKTPFTVATLAEPHIDSLTPLSGPVGQEVMISGADFGFRTDFSPPHVTFGSTVATAYTSWSDTEIKALVPSGVSGSVQVNVHTAGGISNHEIFTAATTTTTAEDPPTTTSSIELTTTSTLLSTSTTTTTAASTTSTTTGGGATTSSTMTTTSTSTPATTTTTAALCPSRKLLGEDNPDLEKLRAFRDGPLAQSAVGRRIIDIYYDNAEDINDALDRSPALRAGALQFLKAAAWLMKGSE